MNNQEKHYQGNGTVELTFQQVPFKDLRLNKANARNMQNETVVRRARFMELVESVRENGVLEPPIVRGMGDGTFEIIAGERRYRALQHLIENDEYFITTVGCMVCTVADDEAFELGLIENLQREDLTPFEAAKAFKGFLDRAESSDAVYDLAARTGIPAHAIRRQVRFLSLPTEILNVWEDGTLNSAHVEAFTRIDDAETCLKVLGECLRRKLSARELREHINGISPDLDRGFFDKTECQTCPSNTSLQSGLFGEGETDGKCINPACFEKKQGAFLTEHWSESKVAEKYWTNGFRFGHRLGQEAREPLPGGDTAARCLGCDAFVTVLRLTGMVVSGYDRTCVGSRECFEELYRQALEPSSESEKPEVENATPETGNEEPEIDDKTEDILSANLAKAREPKKKTVQPKVEGPVFSAQRGEKYREVFFADRLPGLLASTPADHAVAQRLTILALALVSSAARTELVAALGSTGTAEDLSARLFEIPREDLPGQIQRLAIAQVMSTAYSDKSSSGVRQIVAEHFGLELHKDWRLTEDYLQELKKAEIIRIGEEPRVDLWNDEKVNAYRREHYAGKALMQMKKEELIEIIFASGADLAGRVPKEILGEKK